MGTIGMLLATFVAGPPLMAQASAQPSAPDVDSLLQSAKFEVVSIHPDDPDGHTSRIGFMPDGRFVANGITMKRLACMAYGIQDFQMDGGPSWFASERFAIQAKSESQIEELLPKLSNEQRTLVGRQMVKAIFADRLNLALRLESRQMSTLALVVDKNGPRLHEAKSGDNYPNGMKDANGVAHAGMMSFNGTSITAQGVKLDNLASFLSSNLNQIVQNKTGLDGKYDFTLEWSPDADRPRAPQANAEGGSTITDGNSGVSVFTAIKEQLGLKLEPQKSAVPFYVVEKVEKPTEN
jgi:uncharacterized protein (TIGR03435 family)